MDWRELLEIDHEDVDLIINPQISQNTHNNKSEPNNVYSVDYVSEITIKESKLNEIIGDAILGIPITNEEVLQRLSHEEKMDILKRKITKHQIESFSHAIMQGNLIASGVKPIHYKYQAECKYCGPIWLWDRNYVLCCPWCENRRQKRPIPRPSNVTCITCQHFKKNKNTNIGNCEFQQINNFFTLWESDYRYCEYYAKSP